MNTESTRPYGIGSRPMMPGETVGSYRIISEIGKGGMGVVYLAEHAVLGRKVAVKLLRSDVSSEQVDRFLNEARAAAKLHHPGIVETHDFGQHDTGAFIVMEFLAGESLAERLDREPKLPPPLALSIARSVASALRTAHEEGIVHRDLKPANIFLVDDPDAETGVRAKVLDFGIAKLTRDDVPSGVLTNSGAVIGTPRYMSPEQCKNARAVDGRTDIYSLGCMLYEMLVGTPPFDYDNWAELVGAHLHEEPARPAELDPAMRPDVEDLVLRMIAKRADDRVQTMADVVIGIDEVLRASGTKVKGTPGRLRVATPAKGVRAASPAATDPTMLQDPTPDQLRQSGLLPKTRDSVPAPPKARSSTPILIGLGMVLVAGVAITVVVLNSKQEPEVLVVGTETAKRTDLGEPAVSPPDAALAIENAPKPMSNDPVPARPVKALTEDQKQIAALSRTFAGRNAQLRQCFITRPTTASISVRLTINAAGAVTAAEVSPAEVAATTEGQCVAKVARETAFGKQPKAVTVRVPVALRGG